MRQQDWSASKIPSLDPRVFFVLPYTDIQEIEHVVFPWANDLV